jgi:hypothetical protein
MTFVVVHVGATGVLNDEAGELVFAVVSGDDLWFFRNYCLPTISLEELETNLIQNGIQRATCPPRLVRVDFFGYRNKVVVVQMRGHGNQKG